MCLKTTINNQKMQDLTHVKILALVWSRVENKTIGLYQDDIFYRFEPVVSGKNYLFVTYFDGSEWQWQL